MIVQIVKLRGCKACGEWESAESVFQKTKWAFDTPSSSNQGKWKAAARLEVKISAACGLNFVSAGYCFFPATAKLQSPLISL